MHKIITILISISLLSSCVDLRFYARPIAKPIELFEVDFVTTKDCTFAGWNLLQLPDQKNLARGCVASSKNKLNQKNSWNETKTPLDLPANFEDYCANLAPEATPFVELLKTKLEVSTCAGLQPRLAKIKDLHLGFGKFSASQLDLSGLSYLKNLERLTLGLKQVVTSFPSGLAFKELRVFCRNVTDIGFLALVKITKHLTVNRCGLRDLSFINQSPELVELSLSHNEISDLTAIVDLKKLRSLQIDHNALTHLTPLLKLSTLEYISVANNPLVAQQVLWLVD